MDGAPVTYWRVTLTVDVPAEGITDEDEAIKEALYLLSDDPAGYVTDTALPYA